jgi:hypothetical protein
MKVDPRSGGHTNLRGLHQVVLKKEKSLCEGILETMPPRGCKERLVSNAAMEEEMR